ncbi:MAG: UbiX family flavin prenyltransferase [Candidatus Kariarchaeaceae archaeon]
MIIIALTGASGIRYGIRLIDVLSSTDIDLTIILSETSRKLLLLEAGADHLDVIPPRAKIFQADQLDASVASGSTKNRGMIICPCSMKTLASIAHGFADNLISRAADCMLKERRKLVLVARETPLNLIQLRNMVSVTEAGGVILPASPGFYARPTSIDDLVDFVVGKTLDQFNIEHNLFPSWDKISNR